jgi:DNA uptake protein ComE-like DNA-binding protein
MPNPVRINLANPQELMELPGIDRAQVDAILRFRAEHGPILDVAQLSGILGSGRLDQALLEKINFAPSDDTAPEAPGA